MRKKGCLGMLLLTCVLLSACKNSETTVTETKRTTKTQEARETSEMEETTANSDRFKIEGSDVFFSYRDVIGIQDYVPQGVSFLDDEKLMLLYVDAAGTSVLVNTLDTKSGETRKYASWNVDKCDGRYFELVSTAPLVVHNAEDNIWYMWDSDKEAVYTLKDREEVISRSVYAKEAVYRANIERNEIERTDFRTGKRECVFDADVTGYFLEELICAEDENIFIADAIENDSTQKYICRVNTLNGEVTPLIKTYIDESQRGSNNTYLAHNDEYLYLFKHSDEGIRTIEIPQSVYTIFYSIEKDNLIYGFTGGDKMLEIREADLEKEQEFTIGKLNLKRYEDKQIPKSIDEVMAVSSRAGVLSPDGKSMVVAIDSLPGIVDIIVAKIPQNAKTESLNVIETPKDYPVNIKQHTVYEEYEEKLGKIRLEKGINLIIGQNVRSEYPFYKAETCEDKEKIGDAINKIEKALDKYPENFFSYLRNGGYRRGFNIYLTGKIEATDDDAFGHVGGFSTEDNNYALVVMNIDENIDIEDTCYHEFAHVIFDRITYDNENCKDTGFDTDEYEAMNPEGFKYYNAYNDKEGVGYDISGNAENTGAEYRETGDLSRVFFVDKYSKTFMTEDLARMMERDLSAGDRDKELLESLHIRKKLDYFYASIRKTWDSAGWPPETEWEK